MSGRCKTRLALSKIGKKILNVIVAPSLKITIDKSLNVNLVLRFAVLSDAEVLVDPSFFKRALWSGDLRLTSLDIPHIFMVNAVIQLRRNTRSFATLYNST
jgi:hypothetical protein